MKYRIVIEDRSLHEQFLEADDIDQAYQIAQDLCENGIWGQEIYGAGEVSIYSIKAGDL